MLGKALTMTAGLALVDGFGWVFAVCKTRESDINRAPVDAGMAVALPKETTDYVAAEAVAKAKGSACGAGRSQRPRITARCSPAIRRKGDPRQ
jgi:hypothetical protein